MTLTESELLQARIAEMSNLEFDEWLASLSDNYDSGWADGYQSGKEEFQTYE